MTDTTPTTATTPERATTITPELVKSKLQIALTKAEQSVQGLNNAEAELVYNEDNLDRIAKFIENCKAAEKVVETERVKFKEPYLQACRAVDDGAKLLSSELSTVRSKAHTQYTKICTEVERKRQEALKEAARKKGIQDAMDEFKMTYSTKIADAKTSQELVEIERRINVEALNQNKYQEFLEDFKEDCKAIRSLLTAQKVKVRELEALEKEAEESLKNGSDEKFLELQDKKEALEAQISENKVVVQETAVNQASNAAPIEPEIVLPEIKGARRTWDFEVTDLAALYKKAPHLVTLEANKEKIKEIIKTKIADGETKNVSEIPMFGGVLKLVAKVTY
jgi:hypothetical protein